MNRQTHNSPLWRVMFSLFVGLVACGMSFYVILFISLTVMAITHQANPATTPALQADLRHIVLPLSLLAGATVFLASLKMWGKRKDISDTRTEKESNKPAA